MTFEEARAQFPVLERYAYLNAGTFGPMARSVADAIAAEQLRALEEGRVNRAAFEQVPGAAAARPGRGSRSSLGVPPENVALTTSTSEGCNVVLNGLGLAADDEIVTTDCGALRADRAARREPGRGAGRARARPAGGRGASRPILAEVGPRTKLIALSDVLWITGHRLPWRELRERDRRPRARRRRAVGRRDPGRRGGRRLLHRLRPEVAVRARPDRRALRPEPGRACASRSRAISRSASTTSTPGRSSRRRAPTDSTRTSRRSQRPPACSQAFDDPPRVALRACRRDRCALSRAARRARGRRDRARPCDARLVPRRDPEEHGREARGERRDRPRPARHRARPRVVRLVDERRGPRPPG